MSGRKHPFRCEACDIECTNQDAYRDHINGRKHAKAVKINSNIQSLVGALITGERIYCTVCQLDMHVNAWETHVSGKSHAKRYLVQGGKQPEPPTPSNIQRPNYGGYPPVKSEVLDPSSQNSAHMVPMNYHNEMLAPLKESQALSYSSNSMHENTSSASALNLLKSKLSSLGGPSVVSPVQPLVLPYSSYPITQFPPQPNPVEGGQDARLTKLSNSYRLSASEISRHGMCAQSLMTVLASHLSCDIRLVGTYVSNTYTVGLPDQPVEVVIAYEEPGMVMEDLTQRIKEEFTEATVTQTSDWIAMTLPNLKMMVYFTTPELIRTQFTSTNVGQIYNLGAVLIQRQMWWDKVMLPLHPKVSTLIILFKALRSVHYQFAALEDWTLQVMIYNALMRMDESRPASLEQMVRVCLEFMASGALYSGGVQLYDPVLLDTYDVWHQSSRLPTERVSVIKKSQELVEQVVEGRWEALYPNLK